MTGSTRGGTPPAGRTATGCSCGGLGACSSGGGRCGGRTGWTWTRWRRARRRWSGSTTSRRSRPRRPSTCGSRGEVFAAYWRWRRRGAGEDVLEFWIEADAFMRQMIRVLIGTMLEVGGGRRTVASFVELLAGRPRSAPGRTAPAHGLYLAGVGYGGERVLAGGGGRGGVTGRWRGDGGGDGGVSSAGRRRAACERAGNGVAARRQHLRRNSATNAGDSRRTIGGSVGGASWVPMAARPCKTQQTPRPPASLPHKHGQPAYVAGSCRLARFGALYRVGSARTPRSHGSRNGNWL